MPKLNPHTPARLYNLGTMATALRIQLDELHKRFPEQDPSNAQAKQMRDLLSWFADELADIGTDVDCYLSGVERGG